MIGYQPVPVQSFWRPRLAQQTIAQPSASSDGPMDVAVPIIMGTLLTSAVLSGAVAWSGFYAATHGKGNWLKAAGWVGGISGSLYVVFSLGLMALVGVGASVYKKHAPEFQG